MSYLLKALFEGGCRGGQVDSHRLGRADAQSFWKCTIQAGNYKEAQKGPAVWCNFCSGETEGQALHETLSADQVAWHQPRRRRHQCEIPALLCNNNAALTLLIGTNQHSSKNVGASHAHLSHRIHSGNLRCSHRAQDPAKHLSERHGFLLSPQVTPKTLPMDKAYSLYFAH